MEWSWSPYGTDHSMFIPYGIHGLYGMRKWLGSQLNVIPYGLHGKVHGVHGVQVYSIWINPGTVKTSNCIRFTRRPRHHTRTNYINLEKAVIPWEIIDCNIERPSRVRPVLKQLKPNRILRHHMVTERCKTIPICIHCQMESIAVRIKPLWLFTLKGNIADSSKISDFPLCVTETLVPASTMVNILHDKVFIVAMPYLVFWKTIITY